MNTKILEYITAIAKEHSVSKAAERFYLTQPVLSRHLKKIEERLGVPLFLRQKDGMVLTEAGRIYINSAQNILHLESELEGDLRTLLDTEKNTLRIYVDYPYIKQLSDQLLPVFLQKHPNVQVRFICAGTEEIQVSLASGETGIGILTARSRRFTGLEYITLHTQKMVVVKTDSPESAGTIFMQPSGTSLREAEDRWLAQEGAAFSTVLEVQSFQAGLEGVLSGQGCACLPQSIAKDKGLPLLESISPLPLQASVVYPKNMVFRPAARALLQEILRISDEWFSGTYSHP